MKFSPQILFRLAGITLVSVRLSMAAPFTPPLPAEIQITEKETGWPISMVELRTTHQLRFVSDNNGVIAIDAPELLHRQIWFDIQTPGYEVPKDGSGSRGVRFELAPGKTYKIQMTRKAIAKRLGRLTGAGIFAESQKLGRDLDWVESGVFGQDSVQNAVHRGKLFWVWGDTQIPSYPLGIFQGTGATTEIAPLSSLQPPLKLRLNYFADGKGSPRPIAKMPGEGLSWITAFTELPDIHGTGHLIASYMKIKPPLEVVKWGLCEWNDQTGDFQPLKLIWEKSERTPKPPLIPDGHPAFWNEGVVAHEKTRLNTTTASSQKGVESGPAARRWLYFGNPLPKFKCPATYEDWQNTNTWMALTPQTALINAAKSDAEVHPHSGSIAWNPYRRRWIAIFMENFGKPSAFGEIWYAEAKSPEGPWGSAVKILSHDNYTFYNPRIHPEFTATDSPILIFEGTYTQEFANHPQITPRHNYNQILYRLDLDDSNLSAAQKD